MEIEILFEQHGFREEDWLLWSKASFQEASLRSYFEQWIEKLEVTEINLLSDEIDKNGMRNDFLSGLGAQEKRFFQAVEAFHDFIKYGLPNLPNQDTCKIYMPYAADGKDVAALAALLYEKRPFASWKIIAEEHNTLLLSKGKSLIYSATEINNASGFYFQAGGQEDWKRNFVIEDEVAQLTESLRNKITWVGDESTPEKFDVIFCPNTLIKMNAAFRNEELNRFNEMLIQDGLLVLGQYDSLRFTPIEEHYEVITEGETLFKKL